MNGSDDARLLAALAHSADTVIVIDASGTIRMVSPSGPAVFHYDPVTVVGMNALDLLHPDDMVLALEALSTTSVKEGRMEPLALRLQDGQGRWRPVTIVASNRLDDPAVGGIVITVRDDTGSATHERQLAERDDRYRQVVELAAEGVWILDDLDHTSFVSGRMAALLGLRPEDMQGRSVFDFMDDDAAEEAQDLLERRRLGISEDHQFRLRHRDGGDVWVRVAATPVLDHDGSYRGAIAMVSDVSELQRERDRVARAEATHRAVLDAFPDLVFRLSSDGTYLSCHASDPTDLVMPADMLIGRNVLDVLGNEVGGRVLDAIRSSVVGGEPQRLELQLDLGHGRAAFEVRVVRIDDDETVAVARNITDLREAEVGRQELAVEMEHRRSAELFRGERERAARLESLGRLAGGVAHDINNLLGVIGNYAAVLERVPLDPASQEDLRAIEEAVRRGSDLTRRLLLLGQGEEPKAGVVDLARLVTALGPDLRRMALGRDVRLIVGGQPCPVLAHADRLEQALTNLVLNAVDATESGDVIDVEVARRPEESGTDMVILAVRDRGSGMSAEVARRAFEPYYTTKGPDHGTGLGLSIAHGAAADAGGSAWIESPRDGGTRVVLEFPGFDPQGAAPESEPGGRHTDGSSLTVLVVDDDPDALRSASRLLEACGLTVVVASSGVEAEARLRAPEGLAVDVVLTDVVMPQVSGPALAARIREGHPEVPVVLMTAFGADLLPEGAEALAVLHKPLDVDEVIATLRAAVNPAAVNPAV